MSMSPVFLKMFTVDMLERDQDQCTLGDIEAEDFGAFLEAISPPEQTAPNRNNDFKRREQFEYDIPAIKISFSNIFSFSHQFDWNVINTKVVKLFERKIFKNLKKYFKILKVWACIVPKNWVTFYKWKTISCWQVYTLHWKHDKLQLFQNLAFFLPFLKLLMFLAMLVGF